MTSLLPSPPSTGSPVMMNRLRYTPLSGTSRKPSLLDVDRMPCVPPVKMSSRSSNCPEIPTQKESSSSLQTAAADTPSAGVDLAAEKESLEIPETLTKSSKIPDLLTAEEDPLRTESERKSITQDDGRSDLNVEDNVAAAAETKSTSADDDRPVAESRTLRLTCRSMKAVNKPARLTESTTEARPCHRSKSLASSSRDKLHGDPQSHLSDGRSKFATALASSASVNRQPPPTSVKRTRPRNEGSVTIRNLDSRESRVMSGLLTSLMQGSGSRLASASCYKLVRNGRNSSLVGTQALHNKPAATVSSKQYLRHLQNYYNYSFIHSIIS